MRQKLEITKEYLIEELVNKKRRLEDVGKDLGLSSSAIGYYTKMYDIKLREKRDYTGVKYDRITVIRRTDHSQNGHTLWECRCECGKLFYVKSCAIAVQGTKSCGCKRIKDRQKHKNWKGHEEINYGIVASLKRGAKNRGLEFSVTIQEIWDLYIKQDRSCALTGLPIYFSDASRNRDKRTASLDRIDSSKGYITGNIQWVHKTMNTLKMAFSEDELYYWCKLYVNKYENKEKISE